MTPARVDTIRSPPSVTVDTASGTAVGGPVTGLPAWSQAKTSPSIRRSYRVLPSAYVSPLVWVKVCDSGHQNVSPAAGGRTEPSSRSRTWPLASSR
jgi:hypothetical protein